MTNWPQNYLPNCPPDDAELPDGVYYHFIDGNSASEFDFKCKFEKNPGYTNNCQAHGISMIKDLDDITNYREAYINIFGNKKVVEIRMNNNMGVIKNTPSVCAKSHYTWWKPIDIKPWDLCKILEEE
jgi:hypothetical protein